MYRTIYDNTTGKILICRRLTDAEMQERQNTHPTHGFINGHVDDINTKKVDLDTLSIVDITETVNYTEQTRRRRDLLLMECDWTQGVDSPLSEAKKTEWATYRQALRDIPANWDIVNTPTLDITWPSKPE